ncbi:TIGR00730 family Rossman fold protein, partial [Candidatus Saccharibacteria bacterium]|nr:TIGR00730 family Rossman fold protein [Candidatus Saccharibacteria bacterium]
ADAYICMPGGFGTLDELSEVLTLIQTGKTNKAPVILFGRDFWTDFDVFVRKTMIDKFKTVSPDDTSLYTITDDIDEAIALIKNNKTYCAH